MLHLVTGANGFVGSHLVDELLSRGQRVRCLVRRTSDLSFLDTDRPGLEVVYGDLRDADALKGTLRDVTVVHHVAALVKAPDEATFRRVNVEATITLYGAFAQVAPADGVFSFCSSLAAAGPTRNRVPRVESDAPAPISPYGRSKHEAEEALRAAEGPRLIILRPPAVYGPRDYAVLPMFRMAKKGFQVIPVSRELPVSLIHVSDLVAGMADAALRPDRAEGTWFLTDDQVHTFAQFGEELGRAFGTRVRGLVLSDRWFCRAASLSESWARLTRSRPALTRAKAEDVVIDSWVCSSQAATQTWGYAPRLDLATGIQNTARWYEKEGWL